MDLDDRFKGKFTGRYRKRTVKLAYENGINFYDCADAYSGGAAENFLEKFLKNIPKKNLLFQVKYIFLLEMG